MMPYLESEFGNPSSSHAMGVRAREAIDAARGEVAALVGASPGEIVFTSGGTEASNLAIVGLLDLLDASSSRRVVTSVIEHPATAKPCDEVARLGFEVTRIGVDASGVGRLDEAARALEDGAALVTVIHGQNETGVVQPIAELATMARAKGALVHIDAAQSVGKIAIDVGALGVDLLTIAGHKLYAPKGVGALFVRAGVPVGPVLVGAGHERGIRPGTENVASIVGLGAAATIARRDLEKLGLKLTRLRDDLLGRLRALVDGLSLNGDGAPRLPNTLSVRFPGATGSAVLEKAPGIYASTGSACHEGVDSASTAIVAMGIDERDALGTVRLTLGRSTTARDVERAATMLAKAWVAALREPHSPPRTGR